MAKFSQQQAELESQAPFLNLSLTALAKPFDTPNNN